MHGCKTENPSLLARIPFGEIPLRLLVFVFLCRSVQRTHVCAFKEKTRDENWPFGLVVSHALKNKESRRKTKKTLDRQNSEEM